MGFLLIVILCTGGECSEHIPASYDTLPDCQAVAEALNTGLQAGNFAKCEEEGKDLPFVSY